MVLLLACLQLTVETTRFSLAHLDLFFDSPGRKTQKRQLQISTSPNSFCWRAMAAVCAAFASRQLSRSGKFFTATCIAPNPANPSSSAAGAGLFPTIIARRTFSSTPHFNASADSSVRDTLRATTPNAHTNLTPKRGSLASGSIFDDDFDIPQFTTDGPTPRRKKSAAGGEPPAKREIEYVPLEQRDMETMRPVLNPNERRTALWQRKMVIRDIRRRGRLTKAEQIMRTERESLSKSHWFKTSLKKLGPLARQIAGKNIDDAILQMRFSKKKAAKDVKEFLEQAKNEAIVIRGMGIPKAEGEVSPEPVTVTLKDKKKLTIDDPSSIYISQAWVNRGPYGRDFDHRARGNINILRPPHTGISVVLKEERTRIREWQEREQKETRRRESRVWVQLPDRKVTAQNQYYSW